TGLFGFLPQLAGGVARSAEGARSAGPLGNSRVSHGSLRSRPLPAFGRTPPFRCRSTGEKSFGKSSSVPVSLPLQRGRRPTGLFGFLPQLAGGVARSAEGARSAGPPGNSRVSPGSLRSRPLPAFGRTPPFRCRSTGEKSFGTSSSVPVWLPLHGGDVRLVSLDFFPRLLGEWHEVPRGRGPQDRWEPPGCLMARFARAPSRPSAVLPRFAAAPTGEKPLSRPFCCRSTGETSDWSLWISPPAC